LVSSSYPALLPSVSGHALSLHGPTIHGPYLQQPTHHQTLRVHESTETNTTRRTLDTKFSSSRGRKEVENEKHSWIREHISPKTSRHKAEPKPATKRLRVAKKEKKRKRKRNILLAQHTPEYHYRNTDRNTERTEEAHITQFRVGNALTPDAAYAKPSKHQTRK
jgi:hypothetical protein